MYQIMEKRLEEAKMSRKRSAPVTLGGEAFYDTGIGYFLHISFLFSGHSDRMES